MSRRQELAVQPFTTAGTATRNGFPQGPPDEVVPGGSGTRTAPLRAVTSLPPLTPPVKRCLDVVLAVVALILLSPVLAAVALAVRLSSPGPVLFRQERLGLGARPFVMLKFRTMYAGAERLRHTGPTSPGSSPRRPGPRRRRAPCSNSSAIRA